MKRIRIKLKIPIHDEKIEHVEFLKVFFLHKKVSNVNKKNL